MQTNDQILQTIERSLAAIEYPTGPDRLYAPISYAIALGGKRLRPMLLMLTARIFSSRTEEALTAATAVEMFHNFTLLHDDIMDNAALRRGQSSVHARWGQNVAILSGDAMLIKAYGILAQLPAEPLARVMPRFNRMAIEVCEGQQYDMDFEERDGVSVEEYIRMIELKTSALLAGATEIGAMIGGASAEDCERLNRFAIELGIAFQLQDDLLDSYGDVRLGKPIGGDILEGKKTFLMITALGRATVQQREQLVAVPKDAALTDREKIARVRTIYDALEVPRLTDERIARHFEQALAVLDTLSVQGEATDRLRSYARSLMGRNK